MRQREKYIMEDEKKGIELSFVHHTKMLIFLVSGQAPFLSLSIVLFPIIIIIVVLHFNRFYCVICMFMPFFE
jgi:polyferredoxin